MVFTSRFEIKLCCFPARLTLKIDQSIIRPWVTCHYIRFTAPVQNSTILLYFIAQTSSILQAFTGVFREKCRTLASSKKIITYHIFTESLINTVFDKKKYKFSYFLYDEVPRADKPTIKKRGW